MNKLPLSRLRASSGLSCGPAAVCAVTGAEPEAVIAAVRAAAAEDDEFPDHLEHSNFRQQARAVEILGFDLFTTDGMPLLARENIPKKRKMMLSELNQLPTAGDFLARNRCKDVLLCHATPLEGRVQDGDPHTFAVDRKWYVDNQLAVTIRDAPPALANYRMVDALIVRPRQNKS